MKIYHHTEKYPRALNLRLSPLSPLSQTANKIIAELKINTVIGTCQFENHNMSISKLVAIPNIEKIRKNPR